MKVKSPTVNKHPSLPVYNGDDAIPRLIRYCREQGYAKFLLVADENTYPALGQSVQAALQDEGCDVILAILQGEEVIADERYLMRLYQNGAVVDGYLTSDPWRYYPVPDGAKGEFAWTVTVVKVDPAGNVIGLLSPESDPVTIVWQ